MILIVSRKIICGLFDADDLVGVSNNQKKGENLLGLNRLAP